MGGSVQGQHGAAHRGTAVFGCLINAGVRAREQELDTHRHQGLMSAAA